MHYFIEIARRFRYHAPQPLKPNKARWEAMMITAVVQFPLPKGTTRSDAAEMFKQAAPKYREVPGLMRKYFLFDEAAPIGGGVYLWENREAANKVYSPEWRQMVADRYGAEPTITYFDTLLIVDNLVGEISGDEA